MMVVGISDESAIAPLLAGAVVSGRACGRRGSAPAPSLLFGVWVGGSCFPSGKALPERKQEPPIL